MEKDNKRDPVDIMEMVNEFKLKVDAYSELPKDKLIDRLIMCEMELTAREERAEEHIMELWYFVSDETGVKYLSDKEPKVYFTSKYEDFGDDGDTMYVPQQVMMTDGEINIRVPKKMESMFPEIQKDEPPAKVRLSVSF